MSWFSITPFDAEIEKATNEKNTTDQWDAIMTVCDKVKLSGVTKDALKAILRRCNHNDPHVVVQAITLLDTCVINCGKTFHLEVASRDFETEFKKLLSKHEPPISTKLKSVLKKWAEGDFKDDPQLVLIPSLYQKLKSEGHDFTDQTQPKAQVVFSKDPNVVSSQQEEEDIAKAIELSLKEAKSSPKTQSAQSASLYPSVSLSSSFSSTTSAAEPRKVRALYDFEAAEDNELTFVAGEIIHVVDDSDQNWWKGYSKKGEGLFPSNFVTADLSVEPESMRNDTTKNKKSVQFSDEQKEEHNQVQSEIDEEKIDRLFHLLSEANPEDPSQDTEEMLILEHQVNQMGPLIDAELERVDRKHAQLTQLSGELVDAINLYHTLMRESDRPMTSLPYMSYVPQQANMYGMFQPMPNMFLPPNNIGGVSYPSHSIPQPGMVSQPSMPIPQHVPGNSIPGYVMSNQQQTQPGMIPPQLQNGHMGLHSSQGLPLQNNIQILQQQQPIQQPVPVSNNNIQPVSSSSAPMQNMHHAPQNTHMMQPHLQNPMAGQNFAPSEQHQQNPGNMIVQQNMHNMPQQPRTNQHNIPMQITPQQNQIMSQNHIVHQISGASPVHLPSPHLNTSAMHYGTIQTTVLPVSDNKNNIPIYQQQR